MHRFNELPGVDNPERVRKLLQGVAKLEFWEVAELRKQKFFRTFTVDQFVAQKIFWEPKVMIIFQIFQRRKIRGVVY